MPVCGAQSGPDGVEGVLDHKLAPGVDVVGVGPALVQFRMLRS